VLRKGFRLTEDAGLDGLWTMGNYSNDRWMDALDGWIMDAYDAYILGPKLLIQVQLEDEMNLLPSNVS
jgi:hypothetical protein